MRVAPLEVAFEKLCAVVPGQRSVIVAFVCLWWRLAFNCFNQLMHFVDGPWGGAQLAFVQISTCQESSLRTFIKLLTGSQVVGKKHTFNHGVWAC